MFRRVSLRISGQVQGVGFRFFVQRHAIPLGLVGEVWNTRDGCVEIRCEGEKLAVDRLIHQCHQGPSASRVTAVQILEDEITAKLSFNAFSVAPSR